jgi:hypothetical protein
MLSGALGRPVGNLWRMHNGYALCGQEGLEAISRHLASLGAEDIDALRGKLAIAVQSDVEVTDGAGTPGPLVSQAFCSALPVAYTNVPAQQWQSFATCFGNGLASRSWANCLLVITFSLYPAPASGEARDRTH